MEKVEKPHEIEVEASDDEAAIGKLTSSKLAQKNGIKTPELLEKLMTEGLLEIVDGKQRLSAKGKELGGESKFSPKFGKYFLWPENII